MVMVEITEKITVDEHTIKNLTIGYDGFKGLGSKLYVYVVIEPRTEFFYIDSCPEYMLEQKLSRFKDSSKWPKLKVELYLVGGVAEALALGKDIITEMDWLFRVEEQYVDCFLHGWDISKLKRGGRS